MGEKNLRLLEWWRRQQLTKEAAEKIAPKTVILMAGISNSPRNIRDEISQQLFNAKSQLTLRNEADVKSVSNKLFGKELTKDQFIRLSGSPDGGQVKVSASVKFRSIRIEVDHPLYKKDYTSIRTIKKDDDGNIFIENELLVLDSSKTESLRGLGTRIFATQALQASELGIDYIELFAAGRATDKLYNGYYTWARLGYDAPLNASDINSLPSNLKGATKVSDLMNTQEGREWWKQNGYGREMIFDTTNGSDSLKQLFDYLKERGIVL